MAITEAYDAASAEIIRPQDMITRTENFPQIVIPVFQQSILDIIVEKLNPTVITHLNPGYKAPVYKLRYREKDIAVYRTLIGGAGAAFLLEETIALGGRKFLYFGACGMLDRSVGVGQFLIPTEAYRDEGVSYHYCPAGDTLKIESADKLAGIFDALNLPYLKGRTWTTDGFYRETRNNMQKRKAEGCMAVEMECASVMAVGQMRGVEVCQFLYSEDTLDGEAWDARSMGLVPHDDYEKYLRIALEVAVRL